MNILVIGKYYTEGFALHIAETLTAMGHETSRFEAGLKNSHTNNIILHRINQARIAIYDNTDAVPALRAMHMKGLWKQVKKNATRSGNRVL